MQVIATKQLSYSTVAVFFFNILKHNFGEFFPVLSLGEIESEKVLIII